MTEEKFAVVPVRIPQELLRKLDAIAKQQDRSRNYIIRELLKQAIEAKPKGRKG
jgi:predicted transcriptional regulator